MIQTVFFSGCMAAIIYFFVLAGQTLSPSAWIYAAFLLIIFVQIMRTKQISKYRRIFQSVFAVFFMISFIGILYDVRGSMAITADTTMNAENPFCNIIIPAIMVPYALTKTIIYPGPIIGNFAAVVAMLLIWFIATVTIGKGWCSWVCFYGGWEDAVSRFAKKPRIQILSRNKDFRAFQFAFLFFIVLATVAVMSSVYCEWFCPFKLVTEFAPVNDIPTLIATVIFIGLFLGLVIVMPFLTRKRFQCSTLCPFGAFQSLVDRVSGYRILIDTKKCTGCLKCATACPFCAIDIETITGKKGKPEITCAKCGECISACPSKAIRFAYSFEARKKKSASSCEGSCEKPEPKTRVGRIVQSLLDPQNLFIFSAFTFSVVISSRFVPDAINRIMHFFAGGVL